jgi:hypothetical protein
MYRKFKKNEKPLEFLIICFYYLQFYTLLLRVLYNIYYSNSTNILSISVYLYIDYILQIWEDVSKFVNSKHSIIYIVLHINYNTLITIFSMLN